MGNYIKTSLEELTVIANSLRESGNFIEGQKFVFPSAEHSEEPGAVGFAEACEEVVKDFHNKVFHGTLTQDDIDGLVLDKDQYFFYYPAIGAVGSFPNITNITVTADWLEQNDNFGSRFSNLSTVYIQNPNNVTAIGKNKFNSRTTLETIDCSPTELRTGAFYDCVNLIVGPTSLKLDNCLAYRTDCLYNANLPVAITIAEGCTNIEAGAFGSNSVLEKVYLPSIPPELSSLSVFSGNTNIKFYVATEAIKTAYASAENWSDLISKFVVEARE